MDIRVLGPMEVLSDGVPIALGGPRQRTLLALLISRAPDAISPDVLIHDMWGEHASPGARSTLQTLVSNLRQALGSHIPHEPGGYRLDVPLEAIDSWRFAKVVQDTRPSVTTSPGSASQDLRRALAWWRGRPFADLPDVPGIELEVRRLEELRLEAVELRVDSELAAGLHGSLIAELQALAEQHPLREHFRAQHMLALYRSGRQGEALRAYRETEAYLAEELGVDPSPELQQMELAILQQDDSLLAGSVGSRTQRLAVLVSHLDVAVAQWDHDPGATSEALSNHDRILREAVESEQGRIASQTGQGVLAVFSNTVSAVGAAERALHGLEVATEDASGPIRIQIGIDVGEAEVKGNEFKGPPISRAASLCGAAHGGQVLLSSAAQADLAESAPAGLQIRQLGEHRLAGMAVPERVAQLVFERLPSHFPELRTGSGSVLDERIELKSVPGYEMREQIGSDSTGVLWRAYQPSVGREVAIRAIRPDLAGQPWFIRRFEAETRLVARLAHPHIVPLVDFWRDADTAFLVMGIIPRTSLRELVARADLDHAEARRIMSQLCSALDHAHSMGVIHGALRPEHVVFDDAGNAYLSGFGIAQDEARGEDGQSRDHDLASLAVIASELFANSPTVTDLLVAARTKGFANAAELMAAIDAEFGAVEPPPPVRSAIRNPFKGLRSFDQGDVADFYGRDDLLATLLASLHRLRLVAVVGPSGSGKSSVVQAGLLPRLANGAIDGSENWFSVAFTPGINPVSSLAEGLSKVSPESIRPDDIVSSGLAASLGHEVVLVIDQFEEIYTMIDDEEQRQTSVDLITDAVEDPSRGLRIVLCLRADFYDRPLAHPRLGPLVRDGAVSVVPPTRDELMDMIRLPAQSVGLRFEPDLTSLIAEDVFHEPGGLPLLQFAMTELVERRGGDLLTVSDYQRIGGVSGAVAQRAEETYQGLTPAEQEASRAILLRLVTIDEETGGAVRRRVRRSEVEAIGFHRSDVTTVLDRFVAERLLLLDRDPITRGPTVEAAHEALLREWPRLASWIAGQQEALVLARRLRAAVADWEDHHRGEGYLLSGPRLSTYDHWRSDTAPAGPQTSMLEMPALTATERAFLKESRDRERDRTLRRRRRRRLVVGGFAAATAITTVLAVVASLSRASADHSARLALSRELATSAINVLDEDTVLSLLLALEAIEAAPEGEPQPLEAVSALHEAVRNSRLVLARQWDSAAPEGRMVGSLSPDGRLVGVTDLSDFLEVWDSATGDTVWRAGEQFSGGSWSRPHFSQDGAALAAAFSPASDQAASPGTAPPGLYLFDALTGIETRFYESHSECDQVTTPDNTAFDDSATQLVMVVATSASGEETHCGNGIEVQLVDLETSQVTARIPATAPVGEGPPSGTTVSGGLASGMLIVADATGEHGSARAIELDTGEQIWERLAAIAVLSPDASLAAVYPGRDQRGVDLTDAMTGELIRQLQVQGADPAYVAFSADGSKLYTTGFDGTARVWNVATGDLLLSLTGSGVGLDFPSVDAQDTRLGAAGSDGIFYVWDLSVEPLGELMAHDLAPAQVSLWGVATEAGLVASIGFSGRCPDQYATAVLLDAETGQEVAPAFYDITGQSLAISDDGSLLVHQTAAPAGPDVSCADRFDGSVVVKPIGAGDSVSLDGLCSYNQASSLLTHEGAHEEECPFPPGRPYAEFINDIDVTDDALVLAGGESGAASLWDGSTRDLLATFGPHESRGAVQGVAIDRTSELVAVFTGGPQQRLDVYTRDGRRIHSLEYPDAAPASGRIVFNPEGGILAAAVDRLAVYDTETWETLWDPVDAHDGGVGEVDFSPDGTKLVTIGRDGFVKVWAVSNGKLLHVIPLGDDFAKGAAFVDNEHVAIGTQNGVIAVLTIDIEELVQVARTRLTRELTDQECLTYLHRRCGNE